MQKCHNGVDEGEVAAALLGPHVSPRTKWILAHHEPFQVADEWLLSGWLLLAGCSVHINHPKLALTFAFGLFHISIRTPML